MRVIAGSARGRPLKPPTGRTRPSGDKVKGALFSQLEALAYKLGYERTIDDQDLEVFAAAQAWPVVLDLYAGTGALGIEALSRGARQADFVEADPAARRLIQANLRLTGLADRGVVHARTAEQAVSTLARGYDLILADPPYDDSGAARVLERLAASALVGERAVLVWEHRFDATPPEGLGRLRLRSCRRHGIAALALYTTDQVARDAPRGDSPE